MTSQNPRTESCFEAAFSPVTKCIFLIWLCGFSISVYSFPVSPSVKDIAGKFPIDLQQKYTLFADSADPALGYFVAKQAGIANRSGEAGVNLKVSSGSFTEQPFIQNPIRIIGAFDSSGAKSDLSDLFAVAKNLGMTLRPAPISDAEKIFIADGFVTDASGKIQPYCSLQSVTLSTGIVIQLPHCSALDQNGNIRPLQSIYVLDSSPIDKNANAQQNLAFDAKAFNEMEPLISELLASGAGWDNFFSGQLRWQINNGKQTEIATLTVNWVELYSELVKYIASVNYVVTQQDIYLLALRMTNDTRLANAVKIKLASGYSWGPWWNPNIKLMENVADEILRVIKSKALIIVEAKAVGANSTKRFYAINIDYKKVVETPTQTFALYQRNSTTDVYAYTDLSVQCVVGAVDAEVVWNSSDPRCNYLR
ncbi:MAG TPA: hypothetical protein VLC79_04555 [Cellvibrio sp.]|nr:hypothetical protein [Cellvibrio sp.]